MIPCVVPDREKKGGEEKFQKFQKCFQQVLQSCGVAVGEPGLQDQGESEPGEAGTNQGSPSGSETAEKEEEENQPSETKAETMRFEVEDKAESNVKVEAKVLKVEAMMAVETKLETKVELEVELEPERKTVRYYCYGCSKEMPGVAAGPSCPACDSGNNSQSITGFRVINRFSCS